MHVGAGGFVQIVPFSLQSFETCKHLQNLFIKAKSEYVYDEQGIWL